MKQILRKIYDYLLGVCISFGLTAGIWIVLGCCTEAMPTVNFKNVLFLMLSVKVPWLTNFIFGYSSTLYMKGILHGGLWFMIEMVLFNVMYGVALEAQNLLALLLAFAILYGCGLFLINRVSCKLNMPMRCVAQFNMKVASKILKDG